MLKHSILPSYYIIFKKGQITKTRKCFPIVHLSQKKILFQDDVFEAQVVEKKR